MAASVPQPTPFPALPPAGAVLAAGWKSPFILEPFYERSEAEKEAIKREYKLLLNKPIITCVANLRPPKGHEYLIQALSELKIEEMGFLALLVGDSPLRKELEELVRELGLSERVLFLGSRDRREIPKILAITDIFVLSSLWEGLPTAIIEAKAASCPVVATAVGGVPELILNGENGVLTRPRDPKDLAQKPRSLLQNQRLRERMGKAEVQRDREHFSLEQVVQIRDFVQATCWGRG